MGTDAKLYARIDKSSIYVDREYNIINSMLPDIFHDFIKTNGIPTFMLREIVLTMRDLFQYEDRAILYDDILFWTNTLDDHDYILLINEHDDNY